MERLPRSWNQFEFAGEAGQAAFCTHEIVRSAHRLQHRLISLILLALFGLLTAASLLFRGSST